MIFLWHPGTTLGHGLCAYFAEGAAGLWPGAWKCMKWEVMGKSSCREPHGNALTPRLPQRRVQVWVSGVKWSCLRHRFSRVESIQHLNFRTGLWMETSALGLSADPNHITLSNHCYGESKVQVSEKRWLCPHGLLLLPLKGSKARYWNPQGSQEGMWLPLLSPYFLLVNINSKPSAWLQCLWLCLSKSHPNVRGGALANPQPTTTSGKPSLTREVQEKPLWLLEFIAPAQTHLSRCLCVPQVPHLDCQLLRQGSCLCPLTPPHSTEHKSSTHSMKPCCIAHLL